MELGLNYYRCPNCGAYQNQPPGERKERPVRKCQKCGRIVTMKTGKEEKRVSTGTCKSCGALIRWIRTRAGRSMPCDIAPRDYRTKPGGSSKVVTPAGDVISCEFVTDPSEATGWGYVPHWSTCNAPDKFRNKGRQ